MSTWPSSAEWVAQVRNPSRQSPWPGPRPQDVRDGRDALVGREDDLSEFLQHITYGQLTHLIGPSGVGKTSLLQNGIVPELRERRYVVAFCRDWSDIGDQPFEVFLALRLYDALTVEEKSRFSRNTDIFWELDELGGSAVMILDQFEELIRQGANRRKEVFAFLTEVYLQTRVPVVLSYRSEYAEELADFNLDMRIDHVRTQRVAPIEPKYAPELLQSPRRPPNAPEDWTWESVISPGAVQRIAVLWTEARQAEEHGHATIGLLHLQALLFVLSLTTDGPIDEEAVANLELRAAEAESTGPIGVMTFALEESATTLIGIGRAAAGHVGMDRYLLRGIDTMLTRTVPHLASGGFKLERQVIDLAETVLEDEIASVSRWLKAELKRRGGPDPATFLRAVVTAFLTGATSAGQDPGGGSQSNLGAARDELGAAVDEALPVPLGAEAWQEMLAAGDDKEVTAGPMMGQSPLSALFEQLRRFTWAVLWLHELNLARLTSGDRSGTVTLVHDGLGEALQRWSRRVRSTDRTESLFALVAPEGESHEWDLPDYAEDLCGSAGKPRLLPNLRLRGNSIIGATLRHAVFVNCDLRGAAFLSCTFENVVMLNCRLDGALFSDCHVAGAPTGTPGEWLRASRDRAPVFVFSETLAALNAAELAQYTGSGGTRVVSPEPGQPAYVTDTPGSAVQWADTDGGLKIHGSRLSALTFRGTTFHDATLSFVNVAGSGLDLAELTDRDGGTRPSIDFRESVLRHVAFTGAPVEIADTAKGASDEARRGSVKVTVEGSVMAQCWVGAGVVGAMTAKDSLLAQWWVESSDFTAAIGKGSTAVGNAGMGISTSSRAVEVELPREGVAEAPELADFHVKSRVMDYRRS